MLKTHFINVYQHVCVCVCVHQVFSMFLETLVDFITLHREELQDWLFILLTQLLKKMGADLLGSVQAKVQRALDVTRSVTLYYKCYF